ncbi:MAG: hypothetical protein ABSA76_08820 [Bacteroidales bacterium]|jgi:hypothetical protein
MKKLFALFMVALSINAFAQQKSYVTKTIANWSFEKFPAHYYVVPAKANTDKDPLTGKTLSYQELNNLGQSDGLFLMMQNNGANPYSATYTYKGQHVYTVSFFGNSNVAQHIENWNSDGLPDGPQVSRTLKESGTGYTEEIDIYENGILKTINGVKQAAYGTTYNKDSLLDGNFKFQNDAGEIFEGKAKNGEVIYMKKYLNVQNVGISDIVELKIDSTKIHITKKEKDSDVKNNSETTNQLNCKIKLTNSSNLCNKTKPQGGFNVGDTVTFSYNNVGELTTEKSVITKKRPTNASNTAFQYNVMDKYHHNHILNESDIKSTKLEKNNLKKSEFTYFYVSKDFILDNFIGYMEDCNPADLPR